MTTRKLVLTLLLISSAITVGTLAGCGGATPTNPLDPDAWSGDIWNNPNGVGGLAAQSSPRAGVVPLTTELRATGSSPNGTFVAFDWDFDDGSTGSGETVYHTFNAPGVYAVQLTAIDATQATFSATTEVLALPPVTLEAATGNNLTVAFSARTLQGFEAFLPAATAFRWDFGDGSNANTADPNVSHTYAQAGLWTVTLSLVLPFGPVAVASTAVNLTAVAGVVDAAPPIADAGPDQTVNSATVVYLDGTNSTGHGLPLAYAWQQLSGPRVTLDAPNAPQPAFVAPPVVVTTALDFQLTVTAGAQSASDTITVTVKSTREDPSGNHPPVADAGSNDSYIDTDKDGQETVILNGSRSYDPDEGDSIVSYQWFLGQTLLYQGATPYATVVLPVGVHTITLIVTDTFGATGQVSVQISVVAPTNQPPVAHAGPDQTHVDTDNNGTHQVTLDGSASSDPDGTIDSYLWLSGPSGNQTTLVSAAEPVVEVTLPVGIHDITLVVTDNDGGSAADNLRVTILAAGPSLTVTPTATFHSAGNPGGPFDPPSQSYTLKNDGGQPLNWSAAKTQGWVALSTTGGTLAAGATATVTASIHSNANVLSSGTHTDTLTFTNTSNNAGTTTRSVTLTVNPPPGTLTVSPTSVYTPSGTQGGPFTPASRVYTLQNTGGQALNWSATKTATWLTLSSPTSGTLAAGAQTTVTVSVNNNANALTANNYSDTLTFTNTTDGSGTTTRAVALTVNPPAGTLSVTPATAFSSSGNQGGPFAPNSQAYTLTNTGGQSLNWSAAKTKSWLTLSPTSGTLAAGATATLTVSINNNANALSAGTQTDTVNITNTTNGNGSTNRGVTLTISALPAAMSVSPATSYTPGGPQGGPFTPASASYTVTNSGGQNMTWTVAKTAVWLSLSTNGGTLAPGGSATVTVNLNSNAEQLVTGNYGDTVTFTNTTNGNGTATRAVALSITPPPGCLAVTPGDGLSATGSEGGPFGPSSKTYTLTNSGGQPINWTAAKTKPWVTLSKASGTLAAGASDTVTVSLNAAANDLGSAVHNDTVTFTNTTNTCGNTPRPVVLSISPAGGGDPPMTTASRTSGVAPLGVFFDVIDTPAPAWTSGVVQPRGFGDHPLNTTGVRITRVTANTPLGAGTLTFGAAAKTLRWAAPGHSAGPIVDVSAGGNFALPSGSGSSALHVWVNPAALPASNKTDTISIENGGLNADWASFHYEWDFGNPAPGDASPTDPLWYWERGAKKSDGTWFAKNKAFGWNAAHVYEQPGTYTVTLRIIDDVDNEYTYQQTVTVSDPEVAFNPPHGQTYYFAASGNDTTGNGSQASPFRSWDKARTLAGPNTRLLFRRGDTFEVTTYWSAPSISAPILFGAYGMATDRPRFNVPTDIGFIGAGSLSDARFVDIWLDGPRPAIENPTNNGITWPGYDALILRCLIEGFSSGIACEWRGHQIIQETHSVGNGVRELWAANQQKIAVLGSVLESDVGNRNVARTYVSKLVYANCELRAEPGEWNSIRIMGAGSDPATASGRWVAVRSSKLADATFTIGFDGFAPNRTMRHIQLDGNYFACTNVFGATLIKISDGSNFTITNSQVWSTNLSITFLGLLTGYNGGGFEHHSIRIFNNTIYSSAQEWQRLFGATSQQILDSASTIEIRNNIFSAPAATDTINTDFMRIATPGIALKSDYNCFFAPSINRWGRVNNSSLLLSEFHVLSLELNSSRQNPLLLAPSTGNLRLHPDSPCVNGGDRNVLPWCRLDADLRHRSTATLSIGAFE